jgi:hypothetical protein
MGCLSATCLIIASCLLGCSPERVVKLQPHSNEANMAETPDEHYHRALRIESQRRRALIEDLDTFFLTDRPTRLTRWHVE